MEYANPGWYTPTKGNPMELVKLIEQSKKGKRKALNELYKLLFSRLMGACMRYKKDETEAVSALNQGFMKIIQNLEKYDVQRDFHAWASRVMVHHLIDEYRKSKTATSNNHTYYHDETVVFDQNQIDYNAFENDIQAEELREMLDTLPPIMQRVFNLFAVDGFSHKEISGELNIAEATSRWHLAEARKRLQRLLSERVTSSEKKTLIDVK